jgi:hypothetical protein
MNANTGSRKHVVFSAHSSATRMLLQRDRFKILLRQFTTRFSNRPAQLSTVTNLFESIIFCIIGLPVLIRPRPDMCRYDTISLCAWFVWASWRRFRLLGFPSRPTHRVRRRIPLLYRLSTRAFFSALPACDCCAVSANGLRCVGNSSIH